MFLCVCLSKYAQHDDDESHHRVEEAVDLPRPVEEPAEQPAQEDEREVGSQEEDRAAAAAVAARCALFCNTFCRVTGPLCVVIPTVRRWSSRLFDILHRGGENWGRARRFP